MKFWFYCIVLILLDVSSTRGQIPAGTPASTGRDSSKIIRIIKADKLRVVDKDTMNLNMFVGHVLIQQSNTLIECDSVVQNQKLNMVEAFGNVHINDGDSVHTYSQYLKYLGDSKLAFLRNNVRLTDGKGTLITNELEYDINSGIGSYNTPGKLVSGQNVLTSKEGYYYSQTKEAYFIKDVKLVSPERTVATDSLLYNVERELFTMIAPTTINDGSTIVRTKSGEYDTKKGTARFTSRTIVEDSSQTVIADVLNYDKVSGEGHAEGNVIFRDTAEGVSILSGIADFNNQSGALVATRKPVMIVKQDNDSLYVAADTLVSRKLNHPIPFKADSLDMQTDSIRIFSAYHRVRIYSDSLQGICDSLYYSSTDSVFRMFRNPLLWTGDSQISGDTMYLFTRNQKPYELLVFENGFAISKTREDFFNQIRGTRINGGFVNGEIDFMRAKGNAESVYYLQDDDSAYFGMNYAKADAITMYFGPDGLKRVSWVNSVEGTTYPMKQIPEDKKKLHQFMWSGNRRPKSPRELLQ